MSSQWSTTRMSGSLTLFAIVLGVVILQSIPSPRHGITEESLRESSGGKFQADDLSRSARRLPRCNRNKSENITSVPITNTLSEDLVLKQTISWSAESDYNLIYVKVKKVGGSTVSGVVRGIAQKLKLSGVDESLWIHEEPGVWAAHSRMCVLKPLIDGLQKKSFLMTWIREPAERALSAFYFFPVSRHNVTPTDNRILRYLNDPNNINNEMSYISNSNGRDAQESVPEIMRRYDFIGITERFAESMLVLAHRLGLEIEDILYVKAKDSHHRKVDNKGRHVIPSIPVRGQSDVVQQYLKTEWFEQNAMDYMLWDMVNEEMDRMIAEIDGFDEELKRYQLLLEKVEDQCGDLQNDKIDCLLGDEGCGQRCIREVVYQQKENHAIT